MEDCSASGSGTTCVYKYCLLNYDIPDLSTVYKGTQIQVKLQRGPEVSLSSVCGYLYRFWANVDLQCGPPTAHPTSAPTSAPTLPPTPAPTALPSPAPTPAPTNPTYSPTTAPTMAPSTSPSSSPTMPTSTPTTDPTTNPSSAPTFSPTNAPSFSPTLPTTQPTNEPTVEPTMEPTFEPTVEPTIDPTIDPTQDPTGDPSTDPTSDPTVEPTPPSMSPTTDPTGDPTSDPTFDPTIDPTRDPSIDPTSDPTLEPTIDPTRDPSIDPTTYPTTDPSFDPTIDPTDDPTCDPTADPTADPTTDPTTDPTNDPTIDPTTDPTNNPTLDPTIDPTLDPTSDPTTDPTLEPTSHPTMDTTFNPSNAPSVSPSNAPSNAPSVAPSAAPTLTPSSAPTTCVYYDHEDSTVTEYNENYDVYDYDITALIEDVQNSMDSLEPKDIMMYGAVNMAGETVKCDSSITAETCFIFCYGMIYCRGLYVAPSFDNVKELVIICEDTSSCEAAEIEIINSQITTLTMICSSGRSCDMINIIIESQQEMDITIYCHDIGGLSCYGMSVSLDTNGGYNILNTIIGCYSVSSCDNIYLSATDGSIIDLTMEMYEYSENVQIAYKDYEDITFICTAPNQAHFIRFDIDREGTNLKSDAEIENLAQNMYQGDRFPCEGIVIDCSGSNTKETHQCFMEYESIESINQHTILSSDLYINCYWIDIYKLYEPIILSCLTQCVTDQSDIAASNAGLNESTSVLVGVSIIVCLIVLVLVLKLRITKNDKEPIIVQNPMVIVIGIGDYEKEPRNPDELLCDAYINNLDVAIDVRRLLVLFDGFHYSISPQYKDRENPKIKWTKTDLIKSLESSAELLNESVTRDKDKMDGLIFVISGHGLDNNIITSDYQLIDKNIIHRIFSLQFPASREIPRVFIYDCCDGSDEQTKNVRGRRDIVTVDLVKQKTILLISGYMRNSGIQQREIDVIYSYLSDVKRDSMTNQYKNASNTWKYGEQNPDYRLATLNAANLGFQSKMNSYDGSYMINGFIKRVEQCLQKGGNISFLGEIFDDVQEELGQNKQLPVYVWNNNTRMIQLKVNKKDAGKLVNVEMGEINYDEGKEGQSDDATQPNNGKHLGINVELVNSDSDNT